MTQILIDQLIINTLLLLALTYAYSLSRPRLLRLHSSLQPLLEGSLFGLVAIIGMALPPIVTEGVVLDARAVIIGIAGLYGGLQTVAVAALLSCGFRILLGGIGMGGGIGVILTAAALGYGLHLYRKQRRLERLPAPVMLAFGLLLGLQHLLWVFILPAELVQETFQVLLLPALVIYPLSTFFLSLLLEHERASLQLRDALAFSSTVLKNCADGIIVIDDQGAIQLMNFAAACMFGYAQPGDSDEAITATMKARLAVELIEASYREAFTRQAREALDDVSKQKISGDVVDMRGCRADTSMFEITLSFGAFRHQGFVGVVIVSRDVTALREVQSQTRALDLEQQRVDVLQRFIGDASHDLRTPIAALSTSAYLMGKYVESIQGQLSSENQSAGEPLRVPVAVGHTLNLFRERLHNFNEQIEQLKNLVNDLLDLARVEAADPLKRTVQPIDALIKSVIQMCSPMANEGGVTLSYEPAPDLPSMWIDHGQVTRILNNLLTNAIHYTPSGGSVTVTAMAEDEALVIAVADSGIGIDELELPRIFERLYRSARARKTYVAGTGLGLTIVRKIVEAHSGTIQVQSAVDQGTTFTVTLPLRAPEVAEQDV